MEIKILEDIDKETLDDIVDKLTPLFDTHNISIRLDYHHITLFPVEELKSDSLEEKQHA